jgi:hypothetical protein
MGAWEHIREAERLLEDSADIVREVDEGGREADRLLAEAHVRALIAIAKSLATIYDPRSTPDAVARDVEQALSSHRRPITNPVPVRHLHDPDIP